MAEKESWKKQQNIKTVYLGVIFTMFAGVSAGITLFVESGFKDYIALFGTVLLFVFALVAIYFRGDVVPEKIVEDEDSDDEQDGVEVPNSI